MHSELHIPLFSSATHLSQLQDSAEFNYSRFPPPWNVVAPGDYRLHFQSSAFVYCAKVGFGSAVCTVKKLYIQLKYIHNIHNTHINQEKTYWQIQIKCSSSELYLIIIFEWIKTKRFTLFFLCVLIRFSFPSNTTIWRDIVSRFWGVPMGGGVSRERRDFKVEALDFYDVKVKGELSSRLSLIWKCHRLRLHTHTHTIKCIYKHIFACADLLEGARISRLMSYARNVHIFKEHKYRNISFHMYVNWKKIAHLYFVYVMGNKRNEAAPHYINNFPKKKKEAICISFLFRQIVAINSMNFQCGFKWM